MADETLQFPKTADKPRLQDYATYDKIYAGEHFDAFAIKGEKDFTTAYNRLRYIVANFGGLLSKVMADMLFGEKVTYDLENPDNQNFIDGLFEVNQLTTQLYESALANSRRGDSLFKLRVGTRDINNLSEPATIIIEEQNPAIYFPEFDSGNARYTPSAHTLVWKFSQSSALGEKCYLHKERHTAGFITHQIFEYNEKEEKIVREVTPEDFGFPAVEETKIKKALIIHIPNFRDGTGYFGTSDYKDLIPLFFALNNRITKVDNILDKHSDPILAVPPGVMDEHGKIRKESLGMFEVDNETPGFNKPEYIVWNANLDSAMAEIDKLVEFLFMFSEIAPATMGADKNGQAESGRALKFKLLATIRKRNRKKAYYDQGIKDMLEIAQELAIAWNISIKGVKISKVERPTIDWGDGIINDETEMVANSVARVDAGLSSRADEIARLDGITPDEAKKKVKEIDKESATDVPSILPNGNLPTVPGATPPKPANTPPVAAGK